MGSLESGSRAKRALRRVPKRQPIKTQRRGRKRLRRRRRRSSEEEEEETEEDMGEFHSETDFLNYSLLSALSISVSLSYILDIILYMVAGISWHFIEWNINGSVEEKFINNENNHEVQFKLQVFEILWLQIIHIKSLKVKVTSCFLLAAVQNSEIITDICYKTKKCNKSSHLRTLNQRIFELLVDKYQLINYKNSYL